MYCTNCGQQISDGAKFCPNCGASQEAMISRAVQPVSAVQETYGHVRVTFDGGYSSKAFRDSTVDVYLDYEKIGQITGGKTLNKKIASGSYTLNFVIGKSKIGEVGIDIEENANTDISFIINGKNKPSFEVIGDNYGQKSVKPKAAMPTCPKCGGVMTIQTVAEHKPMGCLAALLLTICTLGIWLIVMLVRKKTKTVTYQVCQSCGYKKKIG